MAIIQQYNDRVHLFGIRHHGPGSARSLCRALEALKPDLVLVEGPPDGQDVLHYAVQSGMEPPVALLIYQPDQPREAVFYPFAVFSPEWQAIRYAFDNRIPVRFMDLPQWFGMASDNEPPAAEPEILPPDAIDIRRDPISHIARAAGYSDGERWWDYMVESRQQGHDAVFAAIQDAMTALREGTAPNDDIVEQRREAYMRTVLRQSLKEGFEKIAVVCGAWHGPALAAEVSAKQDQLVLTGLKKVKTQAAWVPWSYDRLSFACGYQAGVVSPQWYHLLWEQPPNLTIQWMTQAARLMREKDLDASSAHVIESVRLAETLAAMRNRALPGLEEMDEAALTVMCQGNDAPMQVIRKQLVIGSRLGSVPPEVPSSPIQLDFERQQKKLRLPVTTEQKDYDLDLRQPTDLQRSHLLHRLLMIDVPWGQKKPAPGNQKGTFHELWQLQWNPEYVVTLIGACRWGNTVEQAAEARCADAAVRVEHLSELSALLENALLADLPNAVEQLIRSIQTMTAVSADIPALMKALPPLARVFRYGNVRQTDLSTIQGVIQGLAARILIHLPAACSSLDEQAAQTMFVLFNEVHSAILLIRIEELTDSWFELLDSLVGMAGVHDTLGGRSCRLLFDQQRLSMDRLAATVSYSLSTGNDPDKSACWLEGFLAGGGLVLLHHPDLLGLLDEWLCSLGEGHYTQILPLLRRTFSAFPPAERRQIGQQISRGRQVLAAAVNSDQFNYERADRILPFLRQLLGLEEER